MEVVKGKGKWETIFYHSKNNLTPAFCYMTSPCDVIKLILLRAPSAFQLPLLILVSARFTREAAPTACMVVGTHAARHCLKIV